jgi:hypothetical protein
MASSTLSVTSVPAGEVMRQVLAAVSAAAMRCPDSLIRV